MKSRKMEGVKKMYRVEQNLLKYGVIGEQQVLCGQMRSRMGKNLQGQEKDHVEKKR